MPTSPTSLCLDCSSRAIAGSKYCIKHQIDNLSAAYNRDVNRQRSNDGVYHLYRCKRWLQARRRVLKRDPLCKECGCHASTVADHHPLTARELIAQCASVAEFYNLDRLQGLCSRCHAIKSASGR